MAPPTYYYYPPSFFHLQAPKAAAVVAPAGDGGPSPAVFGAGAAVVLAAAFAVVSQGGDLPGGEGAATTVASTGAREKSLWALTGEPSCWERGCALGLYGTRIRCKLERNRRYGFPLTGPAQHFSRLGEGEAGLGRRFPPE